MKKGESVYRSSNNLLVMRWKDKRDVYILSTKHENAEMVEYTDKQKNKIMKPKCILKYNKGMDGIHQQDQMLACFPIMRKYSKGYRKVFFYMSDVALFILCIKQYIIEEMKDMLISESI